MKMKPEHYAILLTAFKATIEVELARLKGQPNMPQTLQELIDWQWAQYPEPTERRLHFDFFWWVRRQHYDAIVAMMDAFYQYANDDHLFTALKAVMKELKA